MANKRTTITYDESIDHIHAVRAAGYSIDYWTRQTAAGQPWSPGAIATFDHPDHPDQQIATSTRQTKAGWAVIIYPQTIGELDEANSTSTT